MAPQPTNALAKLGRTPIFSSFYLYQSLVKGLTVYYPLAPFCYACSGAAALRFRKKVVPLFGISTGRTQL